ncbi:MAG TPA: Uma2 family endonuclease [Planctomycetota bacterium]|nr:Uma2 family endonuclease [Planctomycetota bacterium]
MIARRPGTYTVDDYRALPEGGPQFQLVDGELYEMTPGPNTWHQSFLSELAARLRIFVRERRLGTVLIAPIDVYLSRRDVLQPDILFLSNERRARLVKEGLHGAPDLVVEALSPSTRRLDLGKKREKYAQHGVIEFFVADVDEETIELYRLEEDPAHPARTLRAGDVFTSALLPGFEAKVEELFER